MSAPSIRARRVAEGIRQHVTMVLAREIGDPLLNGLVVTDIGVPNDLSVAWVKVRLLADEGDAAAREEVVRRLRAAAGRIRKGLGPAVRLKRVPELRFDYDVGQDASRRVEELLAEIRSERSESD